MICRIPPPRQTTCVHWLHVALVYFAHWENSEDAESDTEQQLEKMLLWIYVRFGAQKPEHTENMIYQQVDCPLASADSHISGAG